MAELPSARKYDIWLFFYFYLHMCCARLYHRCEIFLFLCFELFFCVFFCVRVHLSFVVSFCKYFSSSSQIHQHGSSVTPPLGSGTSFTAHLSTISPPLCVSPTHATLGTSLSLIRVCTFFFYLPARNTYTRTRE